MTIQFIELDKLERSPINARRTAKGGQEDLKASILAKGLLQNLIVTPNGTKYHVVAGARRLEAMKNLADEGKINADFKVPCQIVEGERAREASLAENTIRQAMHPADEFEAFVGLVRDGKETEEIARRFGVSEKHVIQRLKLGRVAPAIMEAYRDGVLSLDCLQAFTLTDDHERQIRVFEGLNGWQLKQPFRIKEVLMQESVSSESKLARFVGQDEYQHAGGRIQPDLFQEETYFLDVDILQDIAKQKLSAIKDALEEQGWGWVEAQIDRDWEFTHGCSRILPVGNDAPKDLQERREKCEEQLDNLISQYSQDATEEKTEQLDELIEQERDLLDRLGDEIKAYERFDSKKMKKAGCLVTIDSDGKVVIEKGLVKKADRKTADDDDSEPTTDSSTTETPVENSGISNALRQDLAGYRLQVAQVAIARNPYLAFDLFVFCAAMQVIEARYQDDGPSLRFSRTEIPLESKAASEMLEIGKALNLTWMSAAEEKDRFELFRSQSVEEKLRLLAYCIAASLQSPGLFSEGNAPSAFELTLAMTGLNVADYWRPSAEFFARTSKEYMMSVVYELFDASHGNIRNELRKADLASVLAEAFTNPDGYRCANGVNTDKVHGWLPAGMAFLPTPPIEMADEKQPVQAKLNSKKATLARSKTEAKAKAVEKKQAKKSKSAPKKAAKKKGGK